MRFSNEQDKIDKIDKIIYYTLQSLEIKNKNKNYKIKKLQKFRNKKFLNLTQGLSRTSWVAAKSAAGAM